MFFGNGVHVAASVCCWVDKISIFLSRPITPSTSSTISLSITMQGTISCLPAHCMARLSEVGGLIGLQVLLGLLSPDPLPDWSSEMKDWSPGGPFSSLGDDERGRAVAGLAESWVEFAILLFAPTLAKYGSSAIGLVVAEAEGRDLMSFISFNS